MAAPAPDWRAAVILAREMEPMLKRIAGRPDALFAAAVALSTALVLASYVLASAVGEWRRGDLAAAAAVLVVTAALLYTLRLGAGRR